MSNPGAFAFERRSLGNIWLNPRKHQILNDEIPRAKELVVYIDRSGLIEDTVQGENELRLTLHM